MKAKDLEGCTSAEMLEFGSISCGPDLRPNGELVRQDVDWPATIGRNKIGIGARVPTARLRSMTSDEKITKTNDRLYADAVMRVPRSPG